MTNTLHKKLTALALAAGIAVGSTGTALAQSVSVGPAPARVKAFTMNLPDDFVVYEDGSGWALNYEWSGAAPKEFCVQAYCCTRQRGQGGGPRWAHLYLALDHVDDNFDGHYFGRPIVDR